MFSLKQHLDLLYISFYLCLVIPPCYFPFVMYCILELVFARNMEIVTLGRLFVDSSLYPVTLTVILLLSCLNIYITRLYDEGERAVFSI